jgi:hypothetical protein
VAPSQARWNVARIRPIEVVASNGACHARKRLADHARVRLGHEAAELFVIPGSQEGHVEPGASAVSTNDPAETLEARAANLSA